MSRYPKDTTSINRIFKIIFVSTNILYKLNELNSHYFSIKGIKFPKNNSFYAALSEFEERDISSDEWIELITENSKHKELKEKLIFDSYNVWNDFEELIVDHNDFLEMEFFDEVSWKEGDGNLAPPQINRLHILNNLIYYRQMLDTDRWFLINKHNRIYDDYDWERAYYTGSVGISLAKLDIKLWETFEKIIQSIPTPGGATPLLDYYARGKHFAHDISLQSCKKLFNRRFKNISTKYVLSSSFMSSLHSLLLSLATLENIEKPIRVGIVGKQVYFEVLKLFGIAGGAELRDSILGEKFIIKRFPEQNQAEFDVLYFEAATNSPNGKSPKLDDVIKIAKNSSCKVLISDITSNPFAFNEADIRKHNGLFIQLQSLAKYVQLGTNISMGGLAMIHQNNSIFSNQLIANSMYSHNTILGQHPDPNLAKAICRNPVILEKRLIRMKKNAEVFKKLLIRFNDTSKHWELINNKNNTTNIIWIEVKKEWISTAKRIRPSSAPFGLEIPNYDKLEISEYIKFVLEFWLWQPTIGECDEQNPTVKTSFGFNQTTFHILNHRKIYIRISCGIESMELLREIAYHTIKILGSDGEF